MGSKMLFFQFNSSHSLSEVQDAAYKSFVPLGGQVIKTGNGLSIKEGKEGIQFGFAADFDSTLLINHSNPDHYDLSCTINWKMNTLTIICLVVGAFVFGILWIIPLLYLFINPSTIYNEALFRIPSILDRKT